MFAGGIAGAAKQRRQAGDAFIGDDQAAPLDQAPDGRLGAIQGPEKVDRHDPFVNLDAGIHESAALSDAGIVEQHIDAAEAIDDGLHGRFTVAPAGSRRSAGLRRYGRLR